MTRDIDYALSSIHQIIKNEVELKKLSLIEYFAYLVFGLLLAIIMTMLSVFVFTFLVVAIAIWIYLEFGSVLLALLPTLVLGVSMIFIVLRYREPWIHKPIRNFLFHLLQKDN